jgi:GNAT superfamily N-acetyltransferase
MSSLVRFPLSPELLRRLPRHPDWKYEMINGEACLSLRPHPLLFCRSIDLAVPAVPVGDTEIRVVDARRNRAHAARLLVDVWVDEDPYRSLENPAAVLRAEIERSLDTPTVCVVAVAGWSLDATVLVPCSASTVPTLTWLTVRRETRDRGLATALLGAVVDALSARGVRELKSATRPPMLRACSGI